MTALVNIETGEPVEAPSYGEVRDSVKSARASLEDAAEQIVWQIEHRAWTVLGYSDWNAMREAEYGGAAFMVPRAERPELVARMRRSGLTQQEIADTAGISPRTVRDDLLNGDSPVETITNARGQERPASYAPRTPNPAEASPADDADPQVAPEEAAQTDRTRQRTEDTIATTAEPEGYPAPQPTLEQHDREQQETDLADYLGGQESVQNSHYAKAVIQALQKAQAISAYDATRFASQATEHDVLLIDLVADSVAEFRRKFHAERSSGLRLLRGGAR